MPFRIKSPLSISPYPLAILILPILVLTASEFQLSFWGDSSVNFVPTLKAGVISELSARYEVFAAFFFFFAVSISVVAIFSFDLIHRFSIKSIVRVILALIAVIAVTTLFSIFEPPMMKSFETYQLLGEDFMRQALGAGKSGLCINDCQSGNAFDVMVQMVDISNHFVSLAGATVLTGMIFALALPQKPAVNDSERIECMRMSRRTVQRYLYCAGFLLTAGMVWVQAWMSWPAGLISDETQRAAFDDLISGLSLFRGTSYSVLILSVYLPVILILSVRLESLRGDCKEQIELIEKKAKDPLLGRIPLTEALATVCAIMAPILTGAIGSGWAVKFAG